MFDLTSVVLIVLLTLGPARAIPAFAAQTSAMASRERRMFALRAMGATLAVLALVAIVGLTLGRGWRMSPGALSAAMGITLLIGAWRTLAGVWRPSSSPAPATGLILTPSAVAVVLLLFMAIRQPDGAPPWLVVGLVLGVLALDLAGLLTAGAVVRRIGAPAFEAAGWVIAVLVAAIGVQAIVEPLHGLLSDLIPGPDDTIGDATFQSAALLGLLAIAPARRPRLR